MCNCQRRGEAPTQEERSRRRIKLWIDAPSRADEQDFAPREMGKRLSVCRTQGSSHGHDLVDLQHGRPPKFLMLESRFRQRAAMTLTVEGAGRSSVLSSFKLATISLRKHALLEEITAL